MVLLTRSASARACRGGQVENEVVVICQSISHHFTAAVLNYLHCQLAVPHVKIVTPAHSCQILTSPSNPLYSTHFITFAQWFASTLFQSFIPTSLAAIPFQRKHIQQFHFLSEKRIRFPMGRWTSKNDETWKFTSRSANSQHKKRSESKRPSCRLPHSKKIVRIWIQCNIGLQVLWKNMSKNIQRKNGNRSSWPCNFVISFDEANS